MNIIVEHYICTIQLYFSHAPEGAVKEIKKIIVICHCPAFFGVNTGHYVHNKCCGFYGQMISSKFAVRLSLILLRSNRYNLLQDYNNLE